MCAGSLVGWEMRWSPRGKRESGPCLDIVDGTLIFFFPYLSIAASGEGLWALGYNPRNDLVLGSINLQITRWFMPLLLPPPSSSLWGIAGQSFSFRLFFDLTLGEDRFHQTRRSLILTYTYVNNVYYLIQTFLDVFFYGPQLGLPRTHPHAQEVALGSWPSLCVLRLKEWERYFCLNTSLCISTTIISLNTVIVMVDGIVSMMVEATVVIEANFVFYTPVSRKVGFRRANRFSRKWHVEYILDGLCRERKGWGWVL